LIRDEELFRCLTNVRGDGAPETAAQA
jgi:hypothetical protein